MDKLSTILDIWQSRSLTLSGRVSWISQLMYSTSILDTPYEYIKATNSFLFKFIWKKSETKLSSWLAKYRETQNSLSRKKLLSGKTKKHFTIKYWSDDQKRTCYVGIKCLMMFTYLLYPLVITLKLTDNWVLRGTGVSRRHSGSNFRLGASSSPLRVRVRYGISLLPFSITGTCTTNRPGLPVEIGRKV